MLEVKHNPNKPAERFECETLRVSESHAVLRYVADRDWHVADALVPAGSTTIAHYWPNRNYVAWRMLGPGGGLLGHLFHVACDVSIGETQIVWTDLLLDVWVDAAGALSVLDEEEFEACREQGVLAAVQVDVAERACAFVRNNWRQIASEMDEVTPR